MDLDMVNYTQLLYSASPVQLQRACLNRSLGARRVVVESNRMIVQRLLRVFLAV